MEYFDDLYKMQDERSEILRYIFSGTDKTQLLEILCESAKLVVSSNNQTVGFLQYLEPQIKIQFETSELGPHRSSKDRFKTWFSNLKKEDILKAIEHYISVYRHMISRHEEFDNDKSRETIENMIQTINKAFGYKRIGYELQNDRFVRIDSEVLHQSAIKPAFHLLNNSEGFQNALKEYDRGLNHYFRKEWGDAITNFNSAFESTIDVITSARGRISNKINKLFTKEINSEKLIPVFLNNESFRKLLQTPETIRSNLSSAHGAGSIDRESPKEMCHFHLNLISSLIVFLIQRYNALNSSTDT